MNPNEYISKRLAELRHKLPDPQSYPILYASYTSLIEELESMQSHLSQSTRPEVSIGGQYKVEQGNTRSYLKNVEGFTVAQTHTWGELGLQDLQRIASNLNQLEALRASHGELMQAISDALPDWFPEENEHGGLICAEITNRDVRQMTAALSKAQSLTEPNKTPTAAPQGQK